MKNKFIEKITLAILVVFMAKTAIAAGLPAQIPDKHVDNYQGYGEKYHCDITTEDQKKYSLDLAWSVVPNAKARFPTWNNSFSYKLSESGKSISEIGFDGNFFGYANIDFDYSENLLLKFHGQHSLNTRVGVYYTNAEIIFTQDEMEKLKLQKFDYKHDLWLDYSDFNNTVLQKINLDIADSQCEKL